MRFWKRKGKETEPNPIVNRILNKLERLKKKWATGMGKLAARLSVRQQKITGVFLALLCSCYCVLLITQGITGRGKGITPSANISNPVTPNQGRTMITTSGYEKERKHIIAVRHYIDSLKLDPYGKKQYDSILLNRPGLLDTLKILETYYQSE